MDIILTVGALLTIIVVLCTTYKIRKKLKKRERKSRATEEGGSKKIPLAKRFKNGLKIIFSGGQIITTLPAVIPMITLPPIFKTAVSKAAKVLNADVFSLVPIGCLTSSPFDFYTHLVTTTLFIISLCLLLLVLGHQSPNKRATYFHVLIAITYLTLPTVTTTIFGVFSCDYFDDDRYEATIR